MLAKTLMGVVKTFPKWERRFALTGIFLLYMTVSFVGYGITRNIGYMIWTGTLFGVLGLHSLTMTPFRFALHHIADKLVF